MKVRQLLISFLLAASILGMTAQVNKTYYVNRSGTLISMMTEGETDNITHLALTGKLNTEDFRYLCDEFSSPKVLDIFDAKIKMYSGKAGIHPNGKFHVCMANFIPAYAFSNAVNGATRDKQTLEKVILSEKVKNIEDTAFKGCDNLGICQICKETASNLLSEALTDSMTAVSIPLGSNDVCRFKNKWGYFTFIEGGPLETTIQIGVMGKLEDEIMKAGLQLKDIDSLIIREKLDNTDFKLIRDYMPNLVSLGISKTNATTVPDFTFAQKKYLLKIKLPHNLKTIGQRVPSNCGRFAGTPELPVSMTAIEFGASTGCDNLRYMFAAGDRTTTLGDELFGNGTPSKSAYEK